MRLTNLHTHTTYCDGSCSVEGMIQSAIKKNFKSIGISSHGPVPFDTSWNIVRSRIGDYIEEVSAMKLKYKNEIDVFLGMEFDYMPEIGFGHIPEELTEKLDYYIGSVHFLGTMKNGTMWTVDYSSDELVAGIDDSFNGNVRSAVESYYGLISEMAERYRPTVIGHIDLIKKTNGNNVIFNEHEDWYINAVEKCLDSIKSSGSAIEINTGAIARGYTKEQYPSTHILRTVKEKGIPITINSDAHTAEGIDCKLAEMYVLAISTGFKSVRCLGSNGWVDEEI